MFGATKNAKQLAAQLCFIKEGIKKIPTNIK